MSRPPVVGSATMSASDLEHLAALVRVRLEALDDPSIRPPSLAEFKTRRHRLSGNFHDFSVDIDIGFTTLTLCEHRVGEHDSVRARPDLPSLARLIVEHVRAVRHDCVALAALEAARMMVRNKVRRDKLQLEAPEVRFTPIVIGSLPTRYPRGTEVHLRVLDDLLRPARIILRGSSRQICAQLSLHGRSEARRRSTLENLNSLGAMLEIEAAAEHALHAVGIGVAQFVSEMIACVESEDPRRDKSLSHWDVARGSVIVRLRGGRITLSADFVDFPDNLDEGVVLSGILPATVMIALVGRKLRALVEHQLLLGDAVIAEVATLYGDRTHVRLSSDARPIRGGEINSELE